VIDIGPMNLLFVWQPHYPKDFVAEVTGFLGLAIVEELTSALF
jgi:hypothetical protein